MRDEFFLETFTKHYKKVQGMFLGDSLHVRMQYLFVGGIVRGDSP